MFYGLCILQMITIPFVCYKRCSCFIFVRPIRNWFLELLPFFNAFDYGTYNLTLWAWHN